MKINCLACGHNVDLSDAYSDYEGLVKCFACGALLEIKTEGGSLKSVHFNSFPQEKDAVIESKKKLLGK